MIGIYQVAVNDNKKTGNGRTSCENFEQLSRIFGSKENVTPSYLIENGKEKEKEKAHESVSNQKGTSTKKNDFIRELLT